MNISVKGTNVIVLYGNGATERYSDLINRWTGMISNVQWESFQFILAGTRIPDLALSESAASLVSDNNTIYYKIDEPAPDMLAYHNLIFDKIRDGNVHLHLVADAGGEDLSYSWLRSFIRSAAQVESLTTTCMFYLLFGRNSLPEEREEILSLLREQNGSVFFLGDTQEKGGRVLQEDRWHAVELAVLMNSAEALPVGAGVYSFGYSALNANGTELRLLRESAACRSLHEELSHPMRSLSESDLYISLLPENVQSVSSLRLWMQEIVRNNTQTPSAAAMKNAWITIRMNQDIAPAEAVARMKRFADLNYAGNEDITASAKSIAAKEEERLKRLLCNHIVTACLSDQIFEEIAASFHQIATEDPQPIGCSFPPKPLLVRFGKGTEAYVDTCKRAVQKSIQGYIEEANMNVFAREMEQAYRNLAEWIRLVQSEQTDGRRKTTAIELLQQIQRELDGSDAGNALRLGKKYKSYQEELNRLHPGIQTLTEEVHGTYYQSTGQIEEKSWRELISKAGENLEKKLPAGFRGDFFKVLGSEFDTAKDREDFFDEFLQNGPRMYQHVTAFKSTGTSVLLADNRLMDQWFMQRDIYEVNTDNAENLTLYPLGDQSPEEYLKDRRTYFLGSGTGGSSGGQSIFSGNGQSSGKQGNVQPDRRRNSLFKHAGTEEQAEDRTGDIQTDVRLMPDEKNEYRLYWPWHKNDPTAMVEVFQFGEKVGRVAVIPVHRFRTNGDNMNITSEVMAGKPLPMGMLTVTIRDSDNNIYIENAKVPGRREIVRYKISNTRLQLKPESRKTVERLALRTIEPDGTQVFYPLYPAENDTAWLYEGLSIHNGKIVVDRTKDGDDIFPIQID